MWIEKRAKDKYKFIERYTDPYTGKTKKVSVTLDKNTNSSRKLAQDILNDKIHELSNIKSSDNITFSELAELYYVYQQKTVKMSTAKRNNFTMKSLAKLLGADTLINNLNASYVMSAFTNSDKNNTTLNEHLTRLKAFLRWGYRNDYVNDITWLDKLERFKVPSHREKIKDKYLEPCEAEQLLNVIGKSGCLYYWYLTKFLLLSGLRIGEAIALNKNDIDLSERVIHINKTYDSNNKLVTSTKTLCSTRDVYIQDELFDLIKKYNTYRRELCTINKCDNINYFITSKSLSIQYCSYTKFLRENSLKALHRKISCHTLRHTHASLLLAEGVNIDSISRRLGHENSKVTREIYLHVTEKLKKADNATLQQIKLL